MTLHVFNPEHDLALAADNPFWTPPHAGRQLRSDLCWLPALWAAEGEAVLVDDTTSAAAAIKRLRSAVPELRRDVTLATADNLSRLPITDVSPWGWDKTLASHLTRHGVPPSALPSEATLRTIRQLSDRHTASLLLEDMCQRNPAFVGQAVSISGIDGDVATAIGRFREVWGAIALKAPWSSSGRGVRFLGPDTPADTTLRWAESIVRKQGHIMVERYLDKVEDFGMEFTATPDGTIAYRGLSLFATRHGAYTGSVLDTEEEKESVLSRYALPYPMSELLTLARQHIAEWLAPRLKGIYAGPFGVDMMVVKTAAGLRLNPCVELNLRRTMGHVALALSPAAPGHRRLMRVGLEGTAYHLRLINDHEILV